MRQVRVWETLRNQLILDLCTGTGSIQFNPLGTTRFMV
jgi:predicted RNA methylase